MRKFLIRFLLVVLLAVPVSVAASSPAYAQARWQNFGANPAYKSRAAAIADAPRVLRQAGYSEQVVAAFKVAMQSKGTRVRLVNGDKLIFMRTGLSGLWRDVLVDFHKPVTNMEFAAPAEEWTVTVDGVAYTVGIPDICRNFYMRAAVQNGCVELAFNAPVGGHVRWGIGSIDGPMEPDVCNAQIQRPGPGATSASVGELGTWRSWYGQCDICVPAMGYLQRTMGSNVQVPHKYFYGVVGTRQTLRFSRAIWTKTVYICLEDANGRRTCGVYVPQNGVKGGWNSRRRVEIQDSFWIWGEENCPPDQ